MIKRTLLNEFILGNSSKFTDEQLRKIRNSKLALKYVTKFKNVISPDALTMLNIHIEKYDSKDKKDSIRAELTFVPKVAPNNFQNLFEVFVDYYVCDELMYTESEIPICYDYAKIGFSINVVKQKVIGFYKGHMNFKKAVEFFNNGL